MAQIIQGDNSTFNALAYGETHPSTLNFIESQLYNTTNMLTDAGQNFFQGASDIYERLNGSDAILAAKAARRAIGSIWQNQEIKHLTSIDQMQWASLPMQRWIMANPTVREKYHNQTIEGYEGSYNDSQPDAVGEDHYDYRRVMNGILVEKGDDWSSTTYIEDLETEEVELTLVEQVDIMDTWENVLTAIRKGGDDPTSRWNMSL